MSLSNDTPFATFHFQSMDMAGRHFLVVVTKATYDIAPVGPPSLSASQDPVALEDERWDRAAPLHLRSEDDIAPFKPRTDILVTATSHAPQGKPAREWLAGVSVGKVAKRILVTGPRAWTYSKITGWTLGSAEPARSVPVRYDLAYGGIAGAGEKAVAYQRNPVGRGYVDVASADRTKPIPAPSLLTPDFAPPTLGGEYPVEGFGPMHKAWLPRREKAGTFDETWRATRHPLLPDDFDPGFYQCAHPDLVYPGFVEGGEEVRLERLHPDHEIVRFKLPKNAIGVLVTDHARYRYGGVGRPDTVHIDAEKMKLHLVYRATLPLFGDGILRIDVALGQPAKAPSAPAAEAS